MHCSYIENYDPKDPKTFKGLDLAAMSMAELYKKYGLDPQTIDFVGHAIALHRHAAPPLPCPCWMHTAVSGAVLF